MRQGHVTGSPRRIARLAALLTAALAGSLAPFPAQAAVAAGAHGSPAFSLLPSASRASAGTQCPDDAIALENSGFEQPSIAPSDFRIFNESLLPGWSTTATDHAVELWTSGYLGVTAYAGSQFAELNANQASALFQDVATRPGAVIHWSLAHRGRDGTDTMRVLIGDPSKRLVEVARFSDGNRAWGRHSGVYTVPAGQATTRFSFDAVATAGDHLSIGNFLDDITFGTDACIEVTKSATVLGRKAPGDRIRWQVTATNVGGSPATNVTISDTIPDKTAYTPDSLFLVTGPQHGVLTDAVDADGGASDGSKVTVLPVGETGIAGRLNPGETATISFETTITGAAAGTTIVNSADVGYQVASGIQKQSQSNEVQVPLPVAADLEITKRFNQTSVIGVNGTGDAGFSLEVVNNGPGRAATVSVSDPLPVGMTVDLTGITIDGNPAGGACILTQHPPVELRCSLGAFADGDSKVIEVPAQYTKRIQGSHELSNRASVAISGAVDPDLSNNTSSDAMAFDPGPNADVAVVVTALNTVMQPGDAISWQVDVQNSTVGIATADGVTVSIAIPYKFTLTAPPAGCTVSDRTLTCIVGSLNARMVRSIFVEGTIDADAPAGARLTLAATVSADPGSNEVPTNDISQDAIGVFRPAVLSITKTALGPVAPTLATRFEIAVTSIGKYEADAVSVHDFYENATAASLPTQCTLVNESIVCKLGDIPAGQTRYLHIDLIPVDASKPIVNHAEANADNAPDYIRARATAVPLTVDASDRSIPGVYYAWRKGDPLPEVTHPDQALPRTGGGSPLLPAAVAMALICAGAMLRRRVHPRG